MAYSVFVALFSVNLVGWGRVIALFWCGLLVVLGVARTLTARRVIKGGRDTEFDGRLLIRIAAAHSVVFGGFVAYALWSVRGQVIPECLLVVGVAGFSSVGATVFAPISSSVQLSVWVQLVPLYVWSAYALPRYGWLLIALFLVHAVVIVKMMRINTAHIREMILAQLTLEAQTDDLRQARDDADRAGSAKMRFLANMSHEIRTPLNGILGLAEVMNGFALTPEQREVLQDIDRSGHHLLSIVNDILDMAKVSSGKLTLEQVPFDLPLAIRDIVSPATALAEAQQLRFLLEVPPDLPRQVKGDPVRIRQVVSNLLSNAVKFTPSGQVRLLVEVPRPGWIRFNVADTGIGLSPEQKDNLFQEFHQVDASSTRRFGGSGLGLAISRRLAELMGGRMWLESRLGEGSTFFFELPLPADESTAPGTETETPAAIALPPGLRVLVAEDNVVNQKVIVRMLSQAGALVEIAENGREAVERHRESPYDVILMDCQMPLLDGYQATRMIRSLPGNPSLGLRPPEKVSIAYGG